MDLIKDFRDVVPWLASLPLIPKIIVSVLTAGVGAFILALAWTPQPEAAVKRAFPWLISLPPIPKIIVSVLTAGVGAFILALVWTPQPETAIETVLKQCYRRALFTRTHLHLDIDGMFKSIDKCRASLQERIPEIGRKDLQSIAVELLSQLEQIEKLP